MMPFGKIFVATDFGPSAERAVEVGADLCARWDSELVLLHVWRVPALGYSGMMSSVHDVLAPIHDEAALTLDLCVERASLRTTYVTGLLRSGTAWHEIRNAIDDVAPDLVVLGAGERGKFAHALLGSVAEKIVRISPVPVLTVPAVGESRETRG